jgi:hypothetical protein
LRNGKRSRKAETLNSFYMESGLPGKQRSREEEHTFSGSQISKQGCFKKPLPGYVGPAHRLM